MYQGAVSSAQAYLKCDCITALLSSRISTVGKLRRSVLLHLIHKANSRRTCFLFLPQQEDQFMPNPLSADIRALFEAFFSEGLAGREIGRRMMLSKTSASRLPRKLRQGL